MLPSKYVHATYLKSKITANMRTLLGREDNFSGPHTFKWLFDGFTWGLRVRVEFRVRHLIVIVRVIIKGPGECFMSLCPHKDGTTLRHPNTRC